MLAGLCVTPQGPLRETPRRRSRELQMLMADSLALDFEAGIVGANQQPTLNR
jgi:hypothetical protein